MANEAIGNTGYGYAFNSLEWVAPQIYAISNGLVIATAFVQQDGLAGTFSYLDESSGFEWEGRVLPSCADCEEEIAAIRGGKYAVSAA